MATKLPELKCALCGGEIDAPGEMFRASGTFLSAGDPLAGYCGAPLHWECYAHWPERPRFARLHVDAWVRANRLNPFWWAVYRDDAVYIAVNPSRPVEEASVRLYSVGSDIRVPLADWRAWLADPAQVIPGIQALELEALTLALPTLRARFPSDHALVDAIDPDEKRAPAARD
jgi:hypothetical protein